MKYEVQNPIKALEAARYLYPDSSKRTLLNWIKAGRFSVDGEPLQRANLELAEGQVVMARTTFRPQLIPGLKVLYEDRFLVAIEKPSGLLSVPLDEGTPTRHVLGLLRDHYQTDQIFAVHRIDRDTSGCLIFAKGKDSEQAMKDLFEAHDLTREYFAIVEGRMDKGEGVWENRLLELENYDVVESEEGKDAITHYQILHRSPKYTYIRLRLETGRKHQIRVHCSTAGFPVLGDDRYGSKENPIGRVCLHAQVLEFMHPLIKNKKVSLQSPIPYAFKKLGGQRFL